MLTEEVVNVAEKIARELHEGQMRKTGGPYIEHPRRVAETLKDHGVCVRAAAWLHDTLEDCGISKEALVRRLMGEGVEEPTARLIVYYVSEVTDEYTFKNYPKMNRMKRKAKEHYRESLNTPEGQNIRLADIIDNCSDLDKLGSFGKKMGEECKQGISFLTKGDFALRERAKEILKNIPDVKPQILILKVQCKTPKTVKDVLDRVNKLSYSSQGAQYLEHHLEEIVIN